MASVRHPSIAFIAASAESQQRAHMKQSRTTLVRQRDRRKKRIAPTQNRSDSEKNTAVEEHVVNARNAIDGEQEGERPPQGPYRAVSSALPRCFFALVSGTRVIVHIGGFDQLHHPSIDGKRRLGFFDHGKVGMVSGLRGMNSVQQSGASCEEISNVPRRCA